MDKAIEAAKAAAMLAKVNAKTEKAKRSVATTQNIAPPKRGSGKDGINLVVWIVRADLRARKTKNGEMNAYAFAVLGISDDYCTEGEFINEAEMPCYTRFKMNAEQLERYNKKLTEDGESATSLKRNKKYDDERSGSVLVRRGTVLEHTSFNSKGKTEIYINPGTKAPFKLGEVALIKTARLSKPPPKVKEAEEKPADAPNVDASAEPEVVEYGYSLVFDEIRTYPFELVQSHIAALPKYLSLPPMENYAMFCLPNKPNFRDDELEFNTTRFSGVMVPTERSNLTFAFGKDEQSRVDTIAAMRMTVPGVVVPSKEEEDPQAFNVQLNARCNFDNTSNPCARFEIYNVDLWCAMAPFLLANSQCFFIGQIKENGSNAVQTSTGLEIGRMGDVHDIIVFWEPTLENLGLRVSLDFVKALELSYRRVSHPGQSDRQIVNMRENNPTAQVDHYEYYLVFDKTKRELAEKFPFFPILPKDECYDSVLQQDQPGDWITYQLKHNLSRTSLNYVLYARFVGPHEPPKILSFEVIQARCEAERRAENQRRLEALAAEQSELDASRAVKNAREEDESSIADTSESESSRKKRGSSASESEKKRRRAKK